MYLTWAFQAHLTGGQDPRCLPPHLGSLPGAPGDQTAPGGIAQGHHGGSVSPDTVCPLHLTKGNSPYFLHWGSCSRKDADSFVLRDTSMVKRDSFWVLEEDQGQLQIQAEPYILPFWSLPLLPTSTPSSLSPQIQLCVLLHPSADSNHLPWRSQEQKDYTPTQVNLK